MAETLNRRHWDPLRNFRGKSPHCSRSVLQWVGFACVCMGTFSTAVLQRGIIRVDTYTADGLYGALSPESGLFGYATAAVFLSLFSMLALPIYAKLLFEGTQHTANAGRYVLRLAVCAAVSEVPFDLAMQGKWLDLSAQNPVWALLVALVMIMILRRYADRRSALGTAVKAATVIAACAWALLLRSQMGVLLVLLAAMFYFLANHKGICLAGGMALTMVQFPAPFGMLFTYWYDGKKGRETGGLFYILYPAQLLAFGVLGRVCGG